MIRNYIDKCLYNQYNILKYLLYIFIDSVVINKEKNVYK